MNQKNEIQPDQQTIDDILNLFKSGKLNNAKITKYASKIISTVMPLR